MRRCCFMCMKEIVGKISFAFCCVRKRSKYEMYDGFKRENNEKNERPK